MMITVGNFLFRYRNALFPATCLLLFIPGPPVVNDPLLAASLGAAIALLGQLVRALTIGLDYIVRGGRHGRVYAEGLVVSGTYRLSRNPMYVGNFLIASGLAVAADSWPTLLLAVPLVAFAYAAIVAAEEQYLANKFGAAYGEYQRAVPRWLPRFAALAQTLSAITFHWRRLIVKEYGTPAGWIAVLCGIALYNLWDSGLWTEQHDAVVSVAGVLIGTLALWLLARILKKTRVLQAD